MKRGKSRRLFKKKKSHSNQRLGCIIAIIVLIPICYGLYLYYQQYSVQHSSKPQIETSVSLPTPSGKDLEIPVSLIPRQEQIIRHKGYTAATNSNAFPLLPPSIPHSPTAFLQWQTRFRYEEEYKAIGPYSSRKLLFIERFVLYKKDSNY